MDKTCFALNPDGSCRILAVNDCDSYAECKFYKTNEQRIDDTKAVYARLNILPEGQQWHIANKYYYGKMPWKEMV